jgi:MerR family transcriptional regulator, light-induced transcriptional regulator
MESDLLVEIGPFSERVGVSPDLLRVWERRYGLLAPRRTPNGRRLYGHLDEQRVKAMNRGLARGLRAREAARAALAGSPQSEADVRITTELDDVTQRLRRALDALDDSGAQEQLDHLFAGYSVDSVLSNVILPYLHELGERWACDEIGVGHEHFAANLIQGRLLRLAHPWDGGTGARALLACPPGEQHTLGLLCFGLSLRSRGWRITYLGADTPIPAVAQVAASLDPACIVLSSVSASVFEQARKPLARLAKRYPLVLGGAGARPKLARKLGATALEGDPVSEAARLS